MPKKLVYSIIVISVLGFNAHAASIVWGAMEDNGFSQSNAAELPIGNLVRLGNFSLTNGQIQAFFSVGDIGSLNANFVEVATAKIGDGIGAPSNLAVTSSPDTSAVEGLQMYYWVYAATNNTSNATSMSTAFEMGIFYQDKAVNSSWAFPVQTPAPGSTTVDITQMTNAGANALVAGANVVIGSFPTGTSTAGSAPNFGLAPVVPEPTSAALMLVGLVSLALRRRRQAK